MRLVVLSSLILLAACARPVVEPYNGQSDGVRFDRPAPYVVIKASGDWQVVYLPDPSQPYIARCSFGIGSCDLKPSLENGWNLTGIDATVDRTAALNAILGAVASASGKAPMLLGARRPASSAPGLYRLDLLHQQLIGPLPRKEPKP